MTIAEQNGLAFTMALFATGALLRAGRVVADWWRARRSGPSER